MATSCSEAVRRLERSRPVRSVVAAIALGAAVRAEAAAPEQNGPERARVEAMTLPGEDRRQGLDALPLTHLTMPALHRDPFDRLLVAQAQSEGIMLITADTQVAQSPGPERKV